MVLLIPDNVSPNFIKQRISNNQSRVKLIVLWSLLRSHTSKVKKKKKYVEEEKYDTKNKKFLQALY